MEKQNVIIDWGDGSITDIKNGGDDVIDAGNCNILIRHKYTELDKPYIVKIFGSTYFGFMGENPSVKFDDGSGDAKSYLNHNLTSRIFDYDLPVATCVTNAASVCRYARRLLKVYVYGHSIIRQCANWTLAFSGCRNLRSARGFEDDNLNVSACSEIFANCEAMTETDFIIPRAPRSSTTADTLYNACSNLEIDILELLPKTEFLVSPYKIGKMFYGTKVIINADNIEKVAAKLWNNPNIVFESTSNAFKACPAEIKAYVPKAWGGTAG